MRRNIHIWIGLENYMVQLMAPPKRPQQKMEEKPKKKSPQSFLLELPIQAFKEDIKRNVQNSAVTIVTAETGAGKSTALPIMLVEIGYKVLVLEPRILSCTQLCETMNSIGIYTGYKTGEGSFQEDAPILYCTYGVGIGIIPDMEHWVVVFDEIHEWSAEMDIAPAIHRISGSKAKVVLMSATIDLTNIQSKYPEAPTIEVPGRTYQITDLEPQGGSPLDSIMYCLKQGWNTMVFVPGQREIDEWISRVQEELRYSSEVKEGDFHVLPLIGSLSPEDRKKPFLPNKKIKVVFSTNIGQTGLTNRDLDAVVNLCLDRQLQVVGGVEGLQTVPSSAATNKQRRGRVGRVKVGYYIEHPYHTEQTPDYDTPEILRVCLSNQVLRVSSIGYHMEELDLFHTPPKELIDQAIKELKMLDCLDGDGEITPLGKKVARLPLEPRAGVLFVLAKELGLEEYGAVVASIFSNGSITHRKNTEWQQEIPEAICDNSDLVTQAQVAMIALGGMMSTRDLSEKGLMYKTFVRVAQTIRKLIGNSGKEFFQQGLPSKEEVEILIHLLYKVQKDSLWQKQGRVLAQVELKDGKVVPSSGATSYRKLAFESIISINNGDVVVGKSFEIGRHCLLTEATIVPGLQQQ